MLNQDIPLVELVEGDFRLPDLHTYATMVPGGGTVCDSTLGENPLAGFDLSSTLDHHN
jgi:hypothetical protein